MTKTIPISEIFGPTLSGEAPHAGLRATFVRVFGCNLNCEWCDSRYAIEGKDWKKLTAEEIAEDVNGRNCFDVVITGGEPLLYQEQLVELLKRLHDKSAKYKFYFETNGVETPSSAMLKFNNEYVVSPKLQFFDEDYYTSLNTWAIIAFSGRVVFKFVYESEETIKLIYMVLGRIPLILRSDVYLMPEGLTYDSKKYLECAEVALKNGFNMSVRLQNLLWPKKRGV